MPYAGGFLRVNVNEGFDTPVKFISGFDNSKYIEDKPLSFLRGFKKPLFEKTEE
jgi:hypothetical protein